MGAKRTNEELIGSGVPEDFAEFYRRTVAPVSAYVARRVGDPEVAFDLVAETFARALERRKSYDPERGVAVAWLFAIARHLIIDSVRQGRVAEDARRRLAMPAIALNEDAIELIEHQSRLDLADTLGALPAEQREAVLRRVLAEEPYEQIAQRAGTSEQVVRKRVSRGLAALRKATGKAAS
jgi:RNA polymerase sigma-70 factor (ECF subfamily)